MNRVKKEKRVQNFVLLSIFSSIIIIQAFIPFLGYIPLGVMNATIIQVTVAIGAILLGVRYGAYLGLLFGFTSMWKNTFMPNPTSFIFSPFISVGNYHGDIRSVIICIIPRVLIGVVAALVFNYVDKILNKRKIALILSGSLASLTNTFLVMFGIYFLFGNEYASATSKDMGALIYFIIGIIGTQGILEAIVSAVLTLGIAGVLLRVTDK